MDQTGILGQAVPEIGDIFKGGLVVAAQYNADWNDGGCEEDGLEVLFLLNIGDDHPYVVWARRADGTTYDKEIYDSVYYGADRFNDYC